MCVCVSFCVCMQEHVSVCRCLLTRDSVCMHVCVSDFDYLCSSYLGGFPEHLSLFACKFSFQVLLLESALFLFSSSSDAFYLPPARLMR